jgi:hypothetical protein
MIENGCLKLPVKFDVVHSCDRVFVPKLLCSSGAPLLETRSGIIHEALRHDSATPKLRELRSEITMG